MFLGTKIWATSPSEPAPSAAPRPLAPRPQSMACSGLSWSCGAMTQASAKLGYCIIFMLSLIVSWVLRDVAKPLLMKLPCARPPPQTQI